MTGLLGGGHAIYWDAATAGAEPRLLRRRAVGRRRAEPALAGAVRRGARPLRGRAGARAPCRGVPAGLDALWRRYGRLPWARLVEPALRLARDGVTDAARARRLPGDARARDDDDREGARIYAPAGQLLAGRRACSTSRASQRRSSSSPTRVRQRLRGTLAAAMLEVEGARRRRHRGRSRRRYEARWTEPVEVVLRRDAVPDPRGASRASRSRSRGCRRCVGSTGIERVQRAARRARRRLAVEGHTTNLVTVDSDGNACVLTTSLGLGSGDFLAGLDLHLNSMLGEVDLSAAPLVPGERMESMMAPSLAVDGEGIALAIGAAGGTRLRTALVGVAAGILDEGLEPQAAVERPRFHLAGRGRQRRAGVDEQGLAELERPGSRCAAGRRSTTTSAASACYRPQVLPAIRDEAVTPRRFLPVGERQPAEVAAARAARIPRRASRRRRLSVDDAATEATDGLERFWSHNQGDASGRPILRHVPTDSSVSPDRFAR